MHLVSVPPSVPVAGEVAGLAEVADDSLGGAFGDARAGGDVAQSDVFLFGDAEQHPRMVCEEAPVSDDTRIAVR